MGRLTNQWSPKSDLATLQRQHREESKEQRGQGLRGQGQQPVGGNPQHQIICGILSAEKRLSGSTNKGKARAEVAGSMAEAVKRCRCSGPIKKRHRCRTGASLGAAPGNTAEGTDATSAGAPRAMQGPEQQLSGWRGRGFEALGREMARWRREKWGCRQPGSAVQLCKDGRDSLLLPSRLRGCALALFEKTTGSREAGRGG